MKLFVRDRDFYRDVALIAIPVAMQSVISIGINMMDTVMLGAFGEVQLSASSLSSQFYRIFQVLCMGMGFGASVMTAQYWGRRDIDSMKRIITIMLRIGLGLTVFFTIVTACFPRQILSVYTDDMRIVESGIGYLRIMAVTYLFLGLFKTLTIVLRSVGEVRISLYASIFSFGINIFFNWVFIFGKLGAPRLEIIGAAIGTLIARISEAAIITVYFLLKDHKIGYQLRDFFQNCSGDLKPFMYYSMPVIISDLMLTLGNNMASVVMGHIGTAFVTANAITNVVVQISTVFIQGVSSSSAVIIGNTLGTGDKERAYEQGVTFLMLGGIIGILGGAVIVLGSPFMLMIYNITEETKQVTSQLMMAIALIVVFQTIGSVMTKGVLRGGGDTRFLMVADVVFLWILSVPLGAMAAFVWGFSPFWIYVFLKCDRIAKSILCVGRFRTKKWLKTV